MSYTSSWDLPNPGLERRSHVSPALANGIFTTEPPGKPIGSLEPMENMSPHSTATQLFKYLKIVMIIITKALIVS